MRLKEGQKAIDFRTKDIFGNDINLNHYKGKKILLSFYRYASCPFCNLRISDLIDNQLYFKEIHLEMIAVFQSPNESINQYVGRQNAPFPIIADPERKLYRLYGVETSVCGTIKGVLKLGTLRESILKGFKPGKTDGMITSIPADFIIDTNLTILKVYYGKDISDHMPIEVIKQTISSFDGR